MAHDSLSRREALRLISGSALALVTSRYVSGQTTEVTAAARPTVSASGYSTLTPELTEGPFYIDLERIRRDITEGKPGVPLRLRVQVVRVGMGVPVTNAAVDVWHCDAQGVYSGFSGHLPPPGGGPGGAHHHPPFPPGQPPPVLAKDGKFPPPGGFPPGGPGHFAPPPMHKSDNQLTFLRGVQLTDASGVAEIDTIFPGWYAGRTTHIHVRVHNGGMVADGRYRKGHISHTGQIFFPQDVTHQVYQLPEYAKKESEMRMAQEDDGIFQQGGRQVARLSAVELAHVRAGFFCDTTLAIDPAATPGRA